MKVTIGGSNPLSTRVGFLLDLRGCGASPSSRFIGGVSKKRGSVEHGLLEVSCQIEIEFDETFSDDADDIQRRVEKAYAACRRAVEEELGRQL